MTAPIRATVGLLKVGAYGGAAAEIADARNIEIDDEADLDGYVSSSTAGRMMRLPGALDYRLRFEIYAPDGTLVWTYKAGDHVVAEGYSVAGKGIKGNFYVGRVTRRVDISNREYVIISVELLGDGTAALTTP